MIELSEKRLNFRKMLTLIRWLLLTLTVIFVLMVSATFIFSMSDESTGRGTVEGMRTYDMKSSVQSRITKINFHDGDLVKAGQVMLELDSSVLRDTIDNSQNTIREMEAERDIKLAALELLKHDPLPSDYRHTKIALDESRLRLNNSQTELESYKALWEHGVIAELDYKRHEMEVTRNKMELEKLQADYEKLTGGLAEKIIARAEAEIRMLEIKIENRKKELTALEERKREYCFVAPESGVIAYIPTKIGSYVEQGQTVIQFAAGNGKKFIAYVDESEIFKIKEDQEVRIASSQYNIYEYGYFKGKVMYIGELPLERAGRVYYPVFIRIEDEPQSLRLGSSGEARISTGRDRIIRTIMGTNKRRK